MPRTASLRRPREALRGVTAGRLLPRGCQWWVPVCALFGGLFLAIAYRSSQEIDVSTTRRSIDLNTGDAPRRPSVFEQLGTAIMKQWNAGKTCEKLARSQPEPYTDKYRNQSIDLNGPVYAYNNWEEAASKVQIEKFQIEMQKNASLPGCHMLFKIYNGSLYSYEGGYCYDRVFHGRSSGLKPRYYQTRQLLMLALEVYDLPNIDFSVVLGDGSVNLDKFDFPIPHFGYCIQYGSQTPPGFTLPAFATYERAMGEHQMEFYRDCLNQRYPLMNRIRKAVWRGSPTGYVIRSPKDFVRNRRVSLAFLAKNIPELFDVGLTSHTQLKQSDTSLMKLIDSYAPPRKRIRTEGYNDYLAVIDVDGNTWSERFTGLLTANTPILKQSYDEWIDYFGHLLQDGIHVNFFKPDLSDLAERVAEMLDPHQFSLEEAEERINNQQAFAMEHLSQLGVIRATAYSLVKMKSYTNWEVEMEEGYAKIYGPACCRANRALPKELVSQLREHQA